MKPFHAVLISVVLALAVIGVVIFAGNRIEQRIDRVESGLNVSETWEYQVVFLKDIGVVQRDLDHRVLHHDFPKFQAKLNELGAEGWQLVDIYRGEFETTRFATFKRRVVERK